MDMKNINEWSMKMLVLIMMPLLFACGSSDNDDSEGQDLSSNDEEQIIAEITQVGNEVSDFFMQSESVTEMATHLDKISSLELVETAWVEDDAVVAKLKNGSVVLWYYPTEEESDINDSRKITTQPNLLDALESQYSSDRHPVISSESKICIVNQLSRNTKNKSNKKVTDYLKTNARVFENWGYSVKEVQSEEFTTDFIKDELANYNIVILCTHGKLMEDYSVGNQHWILTGLELKDVTEQQRKEFSKRSDHNEPLVMTTHIKERREDDWLYNDYEYVMVSEQWLKNNLKQFPDNSLMFTVVCHALENNSSFYDSNLKNNNLGCFLGFTSAVYWSFGVEKSMDLFMTLMVMGSTVKGAYDLMDIQHKKYVDEGKLVELQCCMRDKGDKNEVISMCDAMDLGLSVKWGTRNLGAETPFEYGDFYSWGEIDPDFIDSPKREYKYWTSNKHDAVEFLGYDIGGNPLYDAATAKLGKDWRLPTKEECEELINHCMAVSVKDKEFYNMKEWVSGSKGGVLLLFADAAKQKRGGALYLPYYWNSAGGYWTSNAVPEEERTDVWTEIPNFCAYSLYIKSPKTTGDNNEYYRPQISSRDRRVRLYSIRPVYDPK